MNNLLEATKGVLRSAHVRSSRSRGGWRTGSARFGPAPGQPAGGRCPCCGALKLRPSRLPIGGAAEHHNAGGVASCTVITGPNIASYSPG
jgi:hypothetical protein